jgi:DNA-binding NtrC family response regulator
METGNACGSPSLTSEIECIHAFAADRVLISMDCEAENLARRIHSHGGLARESFATVDCSAPGAVLGDEVFERLAAPARQRGGTLFLKEVGRLDPDQQSHLLSALIDGTLASFPAPMPSRVIAATSESLFDRVREGTFDARLFYLLNIVHIDLRKNRE